MNLLEHWIKEVHSVKCYNPEWGKEFPDRKFVKVDLTQECYGRVERNTQVWTILQWADIKEKGYYMG